MEIDDGGIIYGSDRAPEKIAKNLNRSADRGSNTGLSDYKTGMLRVRLKYRQNASNVHFGLDFRFYRNNILPDSCHQSISDSLLHL
jgi:hypothetical protein